MDGLIFNIQKFSLHDGPGIRTDVFFQGCNLRCKWCANPESLEAAPEYADCEAKDYSVDLLMEELVKDKAFYDSSGGGVTLTGGEALLQDKFVCQLCDALHEQGIKVLIETAGCAPSDIFLRVLKKVDDIYIDLKHYDDEKHRIGTGAPITQILSNIRAALASEVPTVIRIPVIPGFNNASEDYDGFARLLSELGAMKVHLLPFHQLGQHKYASLGLEYVFDGQKSLHEEDLESFAKLLRDFGIDVQIGG